MQSKYQTLKGFRDFLPTEKTARDYIQAKITQTFQHFGFEPLQTPTLEYAELLLGKYGAEADKLVYTFTDRGQRQVGLRYDQTVPTARVLTQYQDKLSSIFKRYQIQSVFRADKPQKGRYREFTQCDIDIFGTNSTLADAEILATTYQVFKDIGFPSITIKLNDRQTLFNSLDQYSTKQISILSIIQSIDKLDKLSSTQVTQELINKGLTKASAIQLLKNIQDVTPSNNLQSIIDTTVSLGTPLNSLIFEPTLARGLDYYTGMIFEVTIPEYSHGSLGGGGRYDRLIQDLGGPNIPAVGMAFGFDRIVDNALALQLIPNIQTTTKVLVTIFSPNLQGLSLKVAQSLRRAGINTEIYLNVKDKLAKQLKYANKKSIPYVIVLGEDEAKNNQLTLKNMQTHQQQTLTLEEMIRLMV